MPLKVIMCDRDDLLTWDSPILSIIYGVEGVEGVEIVHYTDIYPYILA